MSMECCTAGILCATSGSTWPLLCGNSEFLGAMLLFYKAQPSPPLVLALLAFTQHTCFATGLVLVFPYTSLPCTYPSTANPSL